MEYIFHWRRFFFWKKVKIVGHNYDEKFNKMILYYKNGSIREIKKWNNCEVFLKTDWVLAVKSKMEVESGQNLKLNMG